MQVFVDVVAVTPGHFGSSEILARGRIAGSIASVGVQECALDLMENLGGNTT